MGWNVSLVVCSSVGCLTLAVWYGIRYCYILVVWFGVGCLILSMWFGMWCLLLSVWSGIGRHVMRDEIDGELLIALWLLHIAAIQQKSVASAWAKERVKDVIEHVEQFCNIWLNDAICCMLYKICVTMNYLKRNGSDHMIYKYLLM